jgi:exosortase/archaeosortase family protein
VGAHVPFALAVGAALVQAAIASRWHDEYFGAVVVGWAFALVLARARRASVALDATRSERVAGLVLFAASLAAMTLTAGRYSTLHRVLPLATGIGLAILASGARRLPASGRELVLLGLPLLHPLPVPLYGLFEHLPETAALASFYLQAVGFPVERLGALLLVPGSAVEVGDSCGGLDTTSLVLALTTVVACAFRATVARSLALVASGALVAFAGNAARVACLAVIASRAPRLYDFFDGEGAGAPAFTVAVVAAALAASWAIVRGGRAARPERRLEPRPATA